MNVKYFVLFCRPSCCLVYFSQSLLLFITLYRSAEVNYITTQFVCLYLFVWKEKTQVPGNNTNMHFCSSSICSLSDSHTGKDWQQVEIFQPLGLLKKPGRLTCPVLPPSSLRLGRLAVYLLSPRMGKRVMKWASCHARAVFFFTFLPCFFYCKHHAVHIKKKTNKTK